MVYLLDTLRASLHRKDAERTIYALTDIFANDPCIDIDEFLPVFLLRDNLFPSIYVLERIVDLLNRSVDREQAAMCIDRNVRILEVIFNHTMPVSRAMIAIAEAQRSSFLHNVSMTEAVELFTIFTAYRTHELTKEKCADCINMVGKCLENDKHTCVMKVMVVLLVTLSTSFHDITHILQIVSPSMFQHRVSAVCVNILMTLDIAANSTSQNIITPEGLTFIQEKSPSSCVNIAKGVFALTHLGIFFMGCVVIPTKSAHMGIWIKRMVLLSSHCRTPDVAAAVLHAMAVSLAIPASTSEKMINSHVIPKMAETKPTDTALMKTNFEDVCCGSNRCFGQTFTTFANINRKQNYSHRDPLPPSSTCAVASWPTHRQPAKQPVNCFTERHSREPPITHTCALRQSA